MFWGERGEDGKNWEEGMERREKRKINKKGVIVGCFFLVVKNLGWEGEGGVFWKEEGLRSVGRDGEIVTGEFFFFFFFMISAVDDHVDHHICTCIMLS